MEMLGHSRDDSLVIGPMMVVPLDDPFGVSGQAPLSSQKMVVPSVLFHDFLCLTMRQGKTRSDNMATLLLQLWLTVSDRADQEVTDGGTWQSVQNSGSSLDGEQVENLGTRVIAAWELGTDWGGSSDLDTDLSRLESLLIVLGHFAL